MTYATNNESLCLSCLYAKDMAIQNKCIVIYGVNSLVYTCQQYKYAQKKTLNGGVVYPSLSDFQRWERRQM